MPKNTVDTIKSINEILEASTGTVGLAFAAYRMLAAIWLSKNPGKTFADYNAFLKTEAQSLGDNAVAWFQANGWIEGADGVWTAPTT